MYWGCIGQCIRNVSWVYYECNNLVSLMYYWCIRTCTLSSCFPSYPGHHLSGAQPIRASSFWHQQPMGMAPGGWGQPWHGSTRHAFLQAGHAHSSMPSWVPCSRNHSWACIQMGITRQESYRKCYITSFNLLLQKRTSEQFHGKEGFYTASLRFSLFWTASLQICSESLWNSQESYPNWFQQFQRSEALHSV